MKEAQKSVLQKQKDIMGYNLSGLMFIKQELEARKTLNVFGQVENEEAEQIIQDKKKRKRKTLVSR
jgi:hypothetical protein